MNFTEDITVRIPGLPREYTFYHISDAHVAYARPEDSDEAKAFAAKQTERWNQAQIAPIDAFTQFVDAVAKEDVPPDAVLMAGDCIDYTSAGNAAFMCELLPKQKTQYIYAWGNHEGGSYTERIPDGRAYYPLLSPVMGGTPDFHVHDFGEFLVVAVDDADKNITDAQTEQMKAVIKDGRPILLLLHIPLRTPANEEKIMRVWGTSFMLGTDDDNASARAFTALVKSPDSHVAAIFAGHIHFSHAGEFAPGRMQYVSAPLFDRFVRRVRVMGT